MGNTGGFPSGLLVGSDNEASSYNTQCKIIGWLTGAESIQAEQSASPLSLCSNTRAHYTIQEVL